MSTKHRLTPLTNKENREVADTVARMSTILRKTWRDPGLQLCAIEGLAFAVVDFMHERDKSYTLDTFIEDLRNLTTAHASATATRRTWDPDSRS